MLGPFLIAASAVLLGACATQSSLTKPRVRSPKEGSEPKEDLGILSIGGEEVFHSESQEGLKAILRFQGKNPNASHDFDSKQLGRILDSDGDQFIDANDYIHLKHKRGMTQITTVQFSALAQEYQNRFPHSSPKVHAGIWTTQPSIREYSRPLKFKREEKVDFKGSGKKAHGSVLYLRQYHRVPGMDEKALNKVSQYQLRMLQELERQRPQIRHVFVEGLYEDLPAGSKNVSLEGFAEDFKDFNPQNPSPDQLKILEEYGAHYVYAALHSKEVSIHRTLNKVESDKIDRQIEQGIDVGENGFDRREAAATRQIISFLKKNPGERVALIFGMDHDFADDFAKAAIQPRINSVKWTESGPAHPQ